MQTTPATSTGSTLNSAEFVVASDVMRKFMAIVERVSRHVGTVLILGETGAGKEIVAHTVHERSPRRNQPFIEINCAALPENLVESELFGYEKGAFSGADAAKPGLFELANQGTIFLDEIGELDLKIQVKLLRILDRAPYYRLGGHRRITIDVRVIAATNRNLKEEVIAGRFRKDLYHRLSQFELFVPPLRTRTEDVVALAEHFLVRATSNHKFSREALDVLQSYSWPGNVRELQNFVNRVWMSASEYEIGASEVRDELASVDAEQAVSSRAGDPEPSTEQLDSLEAKAIEKVLQNTRGHRGKAASRLGISRRTLSRRLREYGLSSSRRAAHAGLDSMDLDSQRSFRADLDVPVSLCAEDGLELNCSAVNLSTSGLAVKGMSSPLSANSAVKVQFAVPESNILISVRARLVWLAADGRAGLTFTEIGATAREEMSRWLSQKMLQEGWALGQREQSVVG